MRRLRTAQEAWESEYEDQAPVYNLDVKEDQNYPDKYVGIVTSLIKIGCFAVTKDPPNQASVNKRSENAVASN